LAWALRKMGVPVGDKPVMGSDWMREKGLTAPTQEGASKVVGDTIGMISPMGFTKQGAQAMIDAGSKLKGLPVGMSIKDVSDTAKSEIIKPKFSGLKTEEGRMGTGVPINVRPNPDVSDMKFYVDDVGQANLDINPIFSNDLSYVKDRHFRAVDDFLWPFGDDVYVRGANTKDDFNYLKTKTHRGSKNWATNEPEGGLSVGRGVESTMFPYSYLVKGKKIGSGSDSEPLLDLASAEPFGKLMSQKQMQKYLKDQEIKKLNALGIDENQIRALRSVPILKKIP